ncbi:MAG TPA: hypothetical protein VGP46_12695 [Acidimicrobiales bacterium]|jgi:hypothetical protein|nr:hypothetical protein [Acidimicrobiales bacterium]
MSGGWEESPLRAKLRRGLTTAMKAGDAVAVSVLRTSLAAIDNAEAVAVAPERRTGEGPIAGAVAGQGAGDVARRDLSETEIRAIVSGELTERRAAAALYRELGREQEADSLLLEADILASVLNDT